VIAVTQRGAPGRPAGAGLRAALALDGAAEAGGHERLGAVYALRSLLKLRIRSGSESSALGTLRGERESLLVRCKGAGRQEQT